VRGAATAARSQGERVSRARAATMPYMARHGKGTRRSVERPMAWHSKRRARGGRRPCSGVADRWDPPIRTVTQGPRVAVRGRGRGVPLRADWAAWPLGPAARAGEGGRPRPGMDRAGVRGGGGEGAAHGQGQLNHGPEKRKRSGG
jgi:hypothetical protein